MSTTGRSERSSAERVAAACRDAGFVRLVAAPTGDALAATGVLGRVFDAAGVPFQASLAAVPGRPDGATDADCRLAIGRPDTTADHTIVADADGPASQRAYVVASELGDPDPVLALAGTTAADRLATGQLSEDATAAGVERRPGIATPTSDLVDGLTHSTLVHGPLSGDEDAADAAVEALDMDEEADENGEEDRRRVASLAALSIVGAPEAPTRVADAVERFLRPHVGGPFETVGGYADVLDALATDAPGAGLGVALGRVDPAVGLPVWRDRASRVHDGVRDATIQRYDGLVVVRDVTGPIAPVARLVRDFRSPEPVVLAVRDGEALATSVEDADVSALLATAGDATGATTGGTATTARAGIDDAAAFVTAVREAL